MASAWRPRVAVVGAGAVGGYFGGMLARAGAHVTLIGRPLHVEVWNRDGLFLDSVHFQERIRVAASTDIAASADADLVLFSVKSLDTVETARALARHVRGDASILSLQAELGVPTPVNQSLLALVKLREAQFVRAAPVGRRADEAPVIRR